MTATRRRQQSKLIQINYCILDLQVGHVGGVSTKEYFISSIVGTNQRGREALSGVSQEIGCKSRVKSLSFVIDMISV